MKITQYPIPSDQYIRTETEKNQLFLHHTAGNPNPFGTFNWWASNSERVATFVAISADGTIVQGFDSNKWAYHLGLSEKHFNAQKLRYFNLDQLSIGIEICNWGPVTVKGTGSKAKYYNIGDKSDSMTVYGDSATLILTEDILSAIKVSHGYMGMPLLGTHISRSKLAKVCQGIERLVVWLDEDKWREARDIADAAKLIGINAKTLLTPKDPKEYNGTEIVQLVG